MVQAHQPVQKPLDLTGMVVLTQPRVVEVFGDSIKLRHRHHHHHNHHVGVK